MLDLASFGATLRAARLQLMVSQVNKSRACVMRSTKPILHLLLLTAIFTGSISSCVARGSNDKWTGPLASALLQTQRRKQTNANGRVNSVEVNDTSSTDETTYYWKEIAPPTKTKKQLEDDLDAMFDGPGSKYQVGGATKPPRRLYWYGSMDDANKTYMPSKEILKDHKKFVSVAERIQQLQQKIAEGKRVRTEEEDAEEQPHPMRMDTYEIQIKWSSRHLKRLEKQRQSRRRRRTLLSRPKPKRIQKFSKLMSIEFHPNGYCRSKSILVEDEKGNRRRTGGNKLVSSIGIGGGKGHSLSTPAKKDHGENKKTVIFGIGKWVVFPWGLMFNINDCHGGNDSGSHNPTGYWFYCDLHLNPFGDYPKLMQGVVLKEEDDKELSSFEELPSFNKLTVGIDDGDIDSSASISYNRKADSTNLVENEYEGDEYNNFLIDHQLEQLMNMWNTKNDMQKVKSWKKRRAGAKKWFRPVVATFSGIGVSEDTADFSYKDRGFGLSQPKTQ